MRRDSIIFGGYNRSMGRLWLALTLMLVGLGGPADATDLAIGPRPSETIVGGPHVSETPSRSELEIYRDTECGTGAAAMLVFGLTVVGGFIIGIIAIVLLRRYRRPAAGEPSEPVSLL